MNLTMFNKDGVALCVRHARNREMAKRTVLHNGWAWSASYVIYKGKRYLIREVYQW